ncbi:hypothetical membrane protein [Pelotomaculum thermopropionicum SI]|uniref:Hypothetical membrane protein n=1 Tax=Pelotomaculum thermopropionicum (strain DSM 13744 / JCM 10971 / SI) TaxID=370438 RepID=A5D1V2_PELTS|nr:hypothetical membrane protein [Pelotomaculum thermopropionicum SI]
MNRNKAKIYWLFLILAGVLFLTCYAAFNQRLRPALTMSAIFRRETPDHLTGKFTTIIDEQGNILSMMARTAYVGDEIYTAEGRGYRVERVQGDRAEARFLGMDPQIVAYNEFYSRQDIPAMKNLAEQKQSSFAVYHTHSDESYVPSDGTEAIPFKGGIYQVGRALVDRLQGKGMQVNYDQTPHDPHDNNAYARSRRTAANLMKSNPAAIFDVHRDGVPDPGYYRANIDGKDVAKLRLVVGRENPRMDANMDFAKRMMAAANNMHPKIVKEIFIGKGNYNQDLMPTALLIEAGTHTNSKEEAARGVAMFSEAIPAVLGVAPAPAAPTAPGAGGRPAGADRGSLKALGWILGLTLIGGLAFLLISSGTWENAKKRLSGFGREFTSFLGPLRTVRRRVKRGISSPDRERAPKGCDPRGNEVLRDARDDVTED